MSECYIVCEGYHDRAFWAGLLLNLGCSDAGEREDGQRKPVHDPWSLLVRGGHFGFHSKNQQFIRLVPAQGKSRVFEIARRRLDERGQKAVNHLVVNVDADVDASEGASSLEYRERRLREFAVRLDESASLNADGDAEIDGGATRISLTWWETNDGTVPGIPSRQTLERIVCAAIASVYPDRGAPVKNWLDSRPNAPRAGPKEHGFSYLAGWYADSGSYEAFFRRLWSDESVAAELLGRLDSSGVLRVAKRIAESSDASPT